MLSLLTDDVDVPEAVLEHFYYDERLQADAWSWWRWRESGTVHVRDALKRACRFPSFRSLVEYRMRDAGHTDLEYPGWKFANDLHIMTPKIGSGLRIQHGYSTWIFAESIGTNFFVANCVTIGVEDGKLPKIGNNVTIRAGAVVMGGIRIGDNVTIESNAYVNFDVKAGATVSPPRAVIV